MSPKSKSIITSTVAGFVFLAAYAIYVSRPENTPDTLQAWAISMLVFLGIAIVALIIIQIVFHIVLAIGLAVSEGERRLGTHQADPGFDDGRGRDGPHDQPAGRPRRLRLRRHRIRRRCW